MTEFPHSIDGRTVSHGEWVATLDAIAADFPPRADFDFWLLPEVEEVDVDERRDWWGPQL